MELYLVIPPIIVIIAMVVAEVLLNITRTGMERSYLEMFMIALLTTIIVTVPTLIYGLHPRPRFLTPPLKGFSNGATTP